MTEERDAPMTLQRLILDYKGDRSYASLSRSCDGDPTDKRLQQIVANGIKAFPAASTIANLAMGLGVSVTDVVLASARSLGLNVSGRGYGGALVLPGVDVLDISERQVLLDIAKTLASSASNRWRAQAVQVIAALSGRGSVAGIEIGDAEIVCVFEDVPLHFEPRTLSHRLNVTIADRYLIGAERGEAMATTTADTIERLINDGKEKNDGSPTSQAAGSAAEDDGPSRPVDPSNDMEVQVLDEEISRPRGD